MKEIPKSVHWFMMIVTVASFAASLLAEQAEVVKYAPFIATVSALLVRLDKTILPIVRQAFGIPEPKTASGSSPPESPR